MERLLGIGHQSIPYHSKPYEEDRLMLDAQQSFRVVNGAVSVIVVAHGAVENVIAENAIKGLSLRSAGLPRICQNLHSSGYAGCARSHELPVDLYHACVTRL